MAFTIFSRCSSPFMDPVGFHTAMMLLLLCLEEVDIAWSHHWLVMAKAKADPPQGPWAAADISQLCQSWKSATLPLRKWLGLSWPWTCSSAPFLEEKPHVAVQLFLN